MNERSDLDLETRQIIGEMIREERNNNNNILFDLMLYGHLCNEKGERLSKKDVVKPTADAIEIDLTKPNAVIKETYTKPMGETHTEIVNGCPRHACRHCTRGQCTSKPVILGKLECNENNNYMAFEARD